MAGQEPPMNFDAKAEEAEKTVFRLVQSGFEGVWVQAMDIKVVWFLYCTYIHIFRYTIYTYL